jgi:NADH pyrophosphatase NudC (nudix superfamily)
MPRTAVHVAGTALLITLCSLGLGAPTAHAGHDGHGEGHHGHGENHHGKHKAKDPGAYAAELAQKLGLDESQGAEVTAIIEEHHAKIQGTKDQIEALEEQVKEQKQAKYDAIKAALTLEQQAAFAEIKGQKRGHDKHGADCGCESCALERAESSKSED